ncbi:MAG: hypothetical protein ACLQAR_13040 [Steroidobacteraceae bacterium]
MDELAESLGRSPELFPYGLNMRDDTVEFVTLSRTDYAQASFLDGRLLTPQTIVQTIPWPKVAAAIESAQLAERCRFIFHIGHVGSTLLSRLIGAHPGAFGLREPLVLRTFAQPLPLSGEDAEARLGGCLKLLSRTFDAEQCAVVKATSFVSELAAELLSRVSAPKALMMHVSPESYLATILGGPNSRQEAKALAPSRLRRLHRRIGQEAWRLESLTEGELSALGWACEMSALAQAQSAAGERALKIDFDRFLARPSSLLRDALRHLDIEASAAQVDAILAGPDIHRYSKAPEHAYDAALRLEVLNEARAIHGAEIRRGLAWLDRAAAQYAPVQDAVIFAQAAR